MDIFFFFIVRKRNTKGHQGTRVPKLLSPSVITISIVCAVVVFRKSKFHRDSYLFIQGSSNFFMNYFSLGDIPSGRDLVIMQPFLFLFSNEFSRNHRVPRDMIFLEKNKTNEQRVRDQAIAGKWLNDMLTC